MFIPRFCKVCRNILPVVGVETDVAFCTSCGTHNTLPADDKRVCEKHYNISVHEINNAEMLALCNEPTTAKIMEDCAECGFPIKAFIHNEKYDTITICLKCHSSS